MSDLSIDEIITVTVCSKCGKGIPPWSPILSVGIDNEPLWFTTTQHEDICNGHLIIVERRSQIERLELEEFMSGEQWTAEQAAKMKSTSKPIRHKNERDAGGQDE